MPEMTNTDELTLEEWANNPHAQWGFSLRQIQVLDLIREYKRLIYLADKLADRVDELDARAEDLGRIVELVEYRDAREKCRYA